LLIANFRSATSDSHKIACRAAGSKDLGRRRVWRSLVHSRTTGDARVDHQKQARLVTRVARAITEAIHYIKSEKEGTKSIEIHPALMTQSRRDESRKESGNLNCFHFV
jgi:hypothetical protein